MASSTSSGTTAAYLRYSNMYCHCGAVAEIKISNTTANPYRLFYTCKKRACTFFSWCNPMSYESMLPQALEYEVTADSSKLLTVEQEIANIKKRVDALEHNNTMFKVAIFTIVFVLIYCFPISALN